MNRYLYKDLIIEVLDEPIYEAGSADNSLNYSKHYSDDGETTVPASKHGIKIYQDEQIVDSCLLSGFGGGTEVYQNSSLLDGDRLLVRCSDTVFCLALPNLELKWKTQADPITCFQIYKQGGAYIVYGELQIAKLDKDGKIIWEFSGRDIFVSIDDEEALVMEDDGILITDFEKTKYKIDFDGKLIWDTCK